MLISRSGSANSLKHTRTHMHTHMHIRPQIHTTNTPPSTFSPPQTHTHTQGVHYSQEARHDIVPLSVHVARSSLLVVLVIKAAVMRRRGTNSLQALWDCHAWCQAASILWRNEQTVSSHWQGGRGRRGIWCEILHPVLLNVHDQSGLITSFMIFSLFIVFHFICGLFPLTMMSSEEEKSVKISIVIQEKCCIFRING